MNVSNAILQTATQSGLTVMQQYNITPPPNYGQNAGYNGNCVNNYTGDKEKEIYWFHPDHLGSSSYITGLDGEVTQNIEYFHIMSVAGDTFGAYGTGEVLGGVSELSVKKLRSGEPAFRTVFNGGGMSAQEAASNIGIALGSKGLGKLNGATAAGAKGSDKTVVGVNNFLISTGMYGAAAANATEIQKKQK
ncbi:hypothetical protein IW15_01930 [Chryseobacterium soli]|uniref:RHS repeat-associated core domain-containing protein n=1 Tax=Chryseobacterium soli TaxID=445961 RepID=A0A086AC13_9FLAO|nr:hypothetical protein [Chryseobacterium soli]KFF14227.1 hypothetical protein IW15_01930 [Chryseobacterium soli]